MTKKGRHFFSNNRVTPSVAAPGHTNPSDTTEISIIAFYVFIVYMFLLAEHRAYSTNK